jgi:hypothetical protein
MTSNLEGELRDMLPGYPWLASHMALRPDTVILRGFHALSSRNMLCMQAALCALEKHLLRVRREDATNKHGQFVPWIKHDGTGGRHDIQHSVQDLGMLSRYLLRRKVAMDKLAYCM